MDFLRSISISSSALTAERLRLDLIANNLANVNTPGYRRQVASLEPVPGNRGVRVTGITTDPSPPLMRYEPGHPEAGPDGYVMMSNVNVVTEMVDMITASRAYEANVTAVDAAKQMALRTLELARR